MENNYRITEIKNLILEFGDKPILQKYYVIEKEIEVGYFFTKKKWVILQTTRKEFNGNGFIYRDLCFRTKLKAKNYLRELKRLENDN